MDGLPDTNDNSLFALDAGGGNGIALQIVDGKGTKQIPKVAGGTAIEWPVNGTTTQLNYKASYVVVNANATSGHANAMVNFSVGMSNQFRTFGRKEGDYSSFYKNS